MFYLGKEEFSGPWIKFKRSDFGGGEAQVILKNIEPTPIYKLVNTKTGGSINRVTIDLDLNEYLKKKMQESHKPLRDQIKSKSICIRKYIDIFQFKQPYNIAFFTFKNIAPFNLNEITFFMFLDFDINGLDGFDDDLGVYNKEEGIIYQYDETDTYAGFCSIKPPDNFEVANTNQLFLREQSIQLNKTIEDKPSEITSVLAWNLGTLETGGLVQVPIIISGGLSVEELILNLNKGRQRATSLAPQVLKSIKSKARQIQDKAFLKMNETVAENC